jgi:hypothetical protein
MAEDFTSILARYARPAIDKWYQGGENMRALAAKPQSELWKDAAIRALMLAPMGLGPGRDAAMAGNLQRAYPNESSIGTIQNSPTIDPASHPSLTSGSMRNTVGDSAKAGASLRDTLADTQAMPEGPARDSLLAKIHELAARNAAVQKGATNTLGEYKALEQAAPLLREPNAANTNTDLQINNPAMDAHIESQWNDLLNGPLNANKPNLTVIEGGKKEASGGPVEDHGDRHVLDIIAALLHHHYGKK